MAWTYNDSVTPGVLTSTGATQGSPDSLLQGIGIVQAANTARGYRNGLVAWFNDVMITTSGGSFIRFDPDSTIEAKGAAYIDPKNGGVIHDYRSTYIINSTGIQRVDNDLNFETGSSLICRRQRPNDPNPRIVYKSFFRHDYPTVILGQAPNQVVIDGLDIYDDGGAASNLKVYFGTATSGFANNVRFFNFARAQQCNSTYNDFYFEQLRILSENSNLPIIHNRSTYYQVTPTAFSGAFRGAIATLNNPTFLNNCWNGLVDWSPDVNAGSRFSLQYSYMSTFRSGLTPVAGVNVRFTRSRESVTANPSLPTWANPADATLTGISDASGTVGPVDLLDAYRAGTDRFNIERFNWTAKARRYDRRTAGETLFENRVLYQHSVDMSAGYSEEVQMLDVPHLTLTATQAAALTGISLAASGSTGGTLTVSGNVTASDIWHYYRAWISQTANFDSNDSWTYDGATLNIGAWNVVVNASATLTANFVTTAAVTDNGEIFGSYTGASGTRVTIRTADDLPLSTYLTVDGVPQSWLVGETRRRIFVQPNTNVRIYAHAYGYKPLLVDVVGNTASDYVLNLLPETFVDTTQENIARALAQVFASGVDVEGRLWISISEDLREYSPQEVTNGLHYFIVTQGQTVAAGAVMSGTLSGFELTDGGFILRSPNFYGKVDDRITSVGEGGIYVPLAVFEEGVGLVPVRKNTSGITLGVALWSKQAANITSQDVGRIASSVLAEVNTSTVLATSAQAVTINEGVQKASLGIPHGDSL